MKERKSILFVLLLSLLWIGRGYGFEGAGTKDSPYKIQSATDLLMLSERVNGGEQYDGVHFFQTSDIDLQGEPWIPIGTEKVPFLGSYDGAGHTVSNLVISGHRSSRLGLFGLVVKGGATGSPYISGIRLEGVTINATRKEEDLAIGALAGEVRSGYTVRGCAAKIRSLSFESAAGGSVTLGGLIGVADGCELWDCWVEQAQKGGAIEVKSSDACVVGGVLGRFEGYAPASAARTARAAAGRATGGGFVGVAKEVWVSDCFSLGDVNGLEGDVAIFIGRMEGSGQCCYTMGKLNVKGVTKHPLMLAVGGEECDNFYYKDYFGLFLSGAKEKYGRKFSEAALKGEILPEGFSQRSWEVHRGQPPLLKMRIGGMSIR